MITTASLAPAPNLVGSDWIMPEGVETTPVYNPSTGETIAATPDSGPAEVDAAVQAAHAALPAWAETPVIERVRVLMRFAALLEANFDEITRLITREHGKTLAESRGDLRRGIENVEYACCAPELLKGENLENVARGIDCEMVRQPVGVCAGICPYNFPAMVPMWMFPMSLACGNTFVLKPSQKVPLTSIRLMELLHEAGLPHGVINLVNGGTAAVQALLTHELVRAVSFVGSTRVAKIVQEIGTKHGKRVQAAGGAKNYVFVLPDADMPKAVDGLSDGAFGCAGQRCMAAATAVTIGTAGDEVVERLREKLASFRVGPTDREPGGQMGAVISAEHRENVAGWIGESVDEGCELALDGRAFRCEEEPNGFYLGPTVIDRVEEPMEIAKTEIFGPVLNLMRFDDLESAIAMANRASYGNGACLFTQSGRAAREFKHRIKAGMVGINVGVPAPMSFFPFSGWDESFMGDLHVQGRESVLFYTRGKVTTSRWFQPGEGDIWAR